MSNSSILSINKIAKITGIGYLIIFVTGFFSNFFVLEDIVVWGNAGQTVQNIIQNEMLFRYGIVGFVIMVIVDLLLAWTLYYLLKNVNKSISFLSALFRIVNAAIFGLALAYLLNVINLMPGAENNLQISSDILHEFISFNTTWLIGLIFFGCHLIVLGYLVFKSNFIPKILGILLLFAGFGYLIDSFANILLPSYDNYKDLLMMIVMVPGIIGELSFTIWLLFKSINSTR
jgi:hypothetical protein